MNIGVSASRPKRSLKVRLSAARVSQLCITAFGLPVVLEVKAM